MRLFAFVSFVSSVLAASRTSPPSGALVVSKSPSSGQYGTVSAAVSAAGTSGDKVIFIYQGTYNEQVLIPARSGKLTIYGYTTDTSSYSANTVTISYNKDAGSAGSNDASGTVRNKAVGSAIYNINIANTYGSGSQAIALSAYAAQQGYYGLKITGYQDTLLANVGTQFYGHSLIQGRTDFIFGQQSPAWFEKVDIRVLAGGTGWITAAGRDSDSNPLYYVFNNCNIAAASGNSVSNGAYYLGRPWRNYARVVFQNTAMSAVVNSAGWAIWNSGDERTDHVTFAEYNNSGAGASGSRASFSKKLSSAVSISTVLGSTSWVDSAYL